MQLYIHVPFCRAKCRYCAFYSVPLDMGELERYLDALLRELRHWGRVLDHPPLETVYLGGGTPSLLPDWALSRLLPEIGRQFALDPALEWTFEANPDSALDERYLARLLKGGVNRLSLGLQSLADDDLRLLGRPHDAARAVAAYGLARRAGFKNIGLDVIWGLPGQREGQWLETLKVLVSMRPEHLSCYGLTLEPDTPLAAEVAEGRLGLPAEAEQGRMYVRGAEYLEEQGYLQYEISNFARMGFVSRHNSGYWEGRDYLGLGPAAVSTLAGRRHENPSDIAKWTALVRSGRIGADAVALSEAEKVREMVMLSLRTAKGLRLAAYRKATGRDFVKDNEALVTALRQNELVRLSRGHLRLTKNGFLVSNVILERLDY